MGIVRLIFAILALLAMHAGAQTAALPLQGETLDKKKTDLRLRAKGKRAAILFGFSKNSQPSMKAWTERLERESGAARAFEVFEVANLQSAPFLVRGFIKSGMRGDVPKGFHSRFLVMTAYDKEWRSYLGYRDAQPDDSYLLVLNAEGTALFRQRAGGVPESQVPLDATLKAALGL